MSLMTAQNISKPERNPEKKPENKKHWQAICALHDIAPDTGLCALFQGKQVAIYRLADNRVFALDNYDPFGKANVMSRGIVGSVGEQLVVSSPLYKQHFDLQSGVCLQDNRVVLNTYAVRLNNRGQIELGAAATDSAEPSLCPPASSGAF